MSHAKLCQTIRGHAIPYNSCHPLTKHANQHQAFPTDASLCQPFYTRPGQKERSPACILFKLQLISPKWGWILPSQAQRALKRNWWCFFSPHSFIWYSLSPSPTQFLFISNPVSISLRSEGTVDRSNGGNISFYICYSEKKLISH